MSNLVKHQVYLSPEVAQFISDVVDMYNASDERHQDTNASQFINMEMNKVMKKATKKVQK